MKKKIIVLIAIITLLIASFLIGTGFQKRTDVVLGDFAVSKDGSKITLNVGVASSMDILEILKIKVVALNHIILHSILPLAD